MKKTIFRLLAVCLTAAMILPILAGCRRDTAAFETPDYVYVAETIPIDGDITDIRHLVYFDNTLFFWSTTVINEETWETTVNIYSMNIDGTNLTALPNYSIGELPTPDAQSNLNINALTVDNDGFLWVAEQGQFFTFDLPDDFDGEDWERWDYYEDLGSIMQVRKLDNTGREILTVDTNALAAGSDWFHINTLSVDGNGYIYIGTQDSIFVLNDNAELQFQIDVGDWVDQLFRMPDGDIAFFGWGEEGRILRRIDTSAGDWGENINIPQSAWQVFPGDEEHFLIYQDGSNLFGIETESGETVRLLNWLESNLSSDGINNIVMLADGRILCTSQTWGRPTRGMMMSDSTFELNILTRVAYADLPERTVLTLATVSLDWQLRSYILDFNRTNPTYRIQVIDYFDDFSNVEDWAEAMTNAVTRLSTDIIAGRIPDILDLSNLPFEQYVARGLLVDLYPLLDADPGLSRGDLMDSVFRAAELDGGLYSVFTSFGINTLIGHPSVVGSDVGWTMSEFLAVLDANPQADLPLGAWLTRSAFLSEAISVNMSEYVDWVAGESHFDTAEFAQLLEIANRFPESFDDDMSFMMEGSNLVAEGRQIMMYTIVGDFQSAIWDAEMFGGGVVYKGFPAESGNGNSLWVRSGLGITSRSDNQDAAWQFVRGILDADWQLENITWSFPTNRTAFEARIEEAMEEPEFDGEMGRVVIGGGMMGGGMRAITQAEIDSIIALIDSTYGIQSRDAVLMDIINESAEDFFAGRQSAADTARIIQSRVSRYISEHS